MLKTMFIRFDLLCTVLPTFLQGLAGLCVLMIIWSADETAAYSVPENNDNDAITVTARTDDGPETRALTLGLTGLFNGFNRGYHLQNYSPYRYVRFGYRPVYLIGYGGYGNRLYSRYRGYGGFGSNAY